MKTFNTDVAQPTLISTAASMGANVASSVIDCRYLDAVAIQANFTGTPTGAFVVQGCIDYSLVNGVVVNAGTWVPLSGLPAMPALGAAGQVLIDLVTTATPYLQVLYNFTSGTGTLNVLFSGKAR